MDSLSQTDPKSEPHGIVDPAAALAADDGSANPSMSVNLLGHEDARPGVQVAPIANQPTVDHHDNDRVEMVPSPPANPLPRQEAPAAKDLHVAPITPANPPLQNQPKPAAATSDIAPPKPAGTPLPMPDVAPEHLPEHLQTAPPVPPKPGRGRMIIIIVAAVVVLAALAAGGWYYWTNRGNQTPATTPTPTATPVTTPTPVPSETPTPSPTPTPSATPAPAAATKPTLNIDGQAVAEGGTATATSNRPVLSGQADPGAAIAITVKPEGISLSSTADQTGNWSVTPTSDLPNGSHTLAIVATTTSGQTSESDFSLAINPVTDSTGQPNQSTLAPTGDPTAIVDALAALVLLLALYGLYRTRPKRG